MLELRIASEMKLAALRDRLQVEFAGKFVIEREAADVKVRIDGRRFGSTGAFEGIVRASLH